MLNVVLSATDFSDHGDNAVFYAAELAHAAEAELHILFIDEGSDRIFSETIGSQEVIEAEREELRSLTRRIHDKHPKLIVHTSIRPGQSASASILRFAKLIHADIIVGGATSTNRLERFLMGSVISELITHSDIPVLCVPPESKYKQIEHIVYATDMNEENINASLRIVKLAESFDAELRFVHVDVNDEVDGSQMARDLVHRLREKIEYRKLSGYVLRSTEFQAGIEKFLRRHRADVVVMFTKSDANDKSVFSKSNTINFSLKAQLPLISLR